MGFLNHQQYFIIFLVQLQAMNEDRSDFQRLLQSDPSVACEDEKHLEDPYVWLDVPGSKLPILGDGHPSFNRESF